MNKQSVAYAVGKLMQVLGGILFIPLGIALYDYRLESWTASLQYPEVIGFLLAIGCALILGTLVSFLTRHAKDQQGIREGFGIVTLGWVFSVLFGCLPFFFHFLAQTQDLSVTQIMICFTDAYFEIMSGFTTTGATIIENVEAIPRSLLFWRNLTQWLGGMGIITLALVVFPAMGISGYQMFKGEVPGPSTDRLLPKLRETAKLLWGVYLLFTLVEIVLLDAGGMTFFDACCHTFGTLATGGFSTKNASIGHYQSAFIEWVVTVFMFLAGVNFLIHYNVLRGKFRVLKINRELHFYILTIVVATIIVTMQLYVNQLQSVEQVQRHYFYEAQSRHEIEAHTTREMHNITSFGKCLRTACFQVVSIVTTTGYGTSDYDLWPHVCRFLLLILMFWGGCSGSTGGGMKMIRVLVGLKVGWREIKKVAKPRLIESINIGDSIVSGTKAINILAFMSLYLTVFAVMVFLMAFTVPDLVTAISAVAATLNNIGPGLSGVGPLENYAWISPMGKWLLMTCMLIGRLEVFTVLVILRPATWKK